MEEALAACRRVGWRSREAFVLSDLGNVRVNVGEYEAARRDQLAALEIARGFGPRRRSRQPGYARADRTAARPSR